VPNQPNHVVSFTPITVFLEILLKAKFVSSEASRNDEHYGGVEPERYEWSLSLRWDIEKKSYRDCESFRLRKAKVDGMSRVF
jgi:hypothetical protein